MGINLNSNIIAIIPAREGSKGLPNKNIKKFSGKPLIVHSIIAAIESGCFKEIIVTTDSDDIAKISLNYKVRVIKRPKNLAQDDSLMKDVTKHVYTYLKTNDLFLGTFFCLLQPTSPLRLASHVIEFVDKFKQGSFRSAVSVCENLHTPFKSFSLKNEQLIPIFEQKFSHANRQSLDKTYRQNGAIYLTNWSNFLSYGCFIHQPVMPYIMTEKESVDIDSLEDFHRAEKFFIDVDSFQR